MPPAIHNGCISTGTILLRLFKKIKQTADGGYIAVGNIEAPGNQGSVQTFIVKLNAAGVLSWSKIITIPNVFSNFGNDIIQAADGSYYFTGVTEQPDVTGSSDAMAGKLDAAGNLLWLVSFDARSSETGNGLTEDNSHLVICGNKSGQAGIAGFLLQVNKSDGSIVWAKTYQSADENFLHVQTVPGGYYVNALRGNSASGLYTDHVYLKTDFTGKISYSTYIQPFGTAKSTDWASSFIKPNGNILSQTTGAFGGTYFDFLIQEINPSTGIVWTKKYNKDNSWMACLASAADNSIWSAGLSTEITGLQTFVMKLDSAGGSGSCPSANAASQLLTIALTTNIADFTAKAIQSQTTRNDNTKPADVVTAAICQFVKCDSVALPVDTCKLCDTLILSGADTICQLKNTATYSIKRSSGCGTVPSWHLSDAAYGTVTIVNDSTATLVFNKPGNVILYATIQLGCKVLSDSIPVVAFNTPSTIDLGPDIQLCKFSTLALHAGIGFRSYSWNDGSVDPVFTAYNPGQYFVHATDFCGMVYSDTINLSQAPDVPFDLGPDLQICDNDTATITAPGNFAAYSWGANYNINTIKGATIKVWPATDTTYTVVAQVATGCTVVDTIRIKVNQAADLHIGNDTSFCAGDSVVLQAPTGFSTYTWQDGSGKTVFTAKQKGIYWLHATGANGCTSKDTVVVENIYPLPSDFVDAMAGICNGKNLEVKAIGSWPSYLWFNNTTGPSVTVTTAGHYWLQVTNAAGCRATDTITVTNNNCGTDIYFPNAFTPDHNGNNDSYKAIVYTVPDNFRLRIYNRFGEKVFETTDFKQGWDGFYKGKLQPPGTYVWYCVYQFAGVAAAAQKGALTLIR